MGHGSSMSTEGVLWPASSAGCSSPSLDDPRSPPIAERRFPALRNAKRGTSGSIYSSPIDWGCSAIPISERGVEGSGKRKFFGCCGPGWRTHVCDAAHDYFNYLILFTN